MGKTLRSSIELQNLKLNTKIGEYGEEDSAQFEHYLDLKFSIDTGYVLIHSDNMRDVYDYDQLVEKIEKLENSGRFITQEYLIKCIVDLCLKESKIMDLEIFLYKKSVTNLSGSYGVRLLVSANEMSYLRQERPST
ncbi:MAG: hypothetical protein CMM44_09855 [Rhodospirillaceae bacterium]|nr:hypothetical protein [Rhodospirillaceae bacterium]